MARLIALALVFSISSSVAAQDPKAPADGAVEDLPTRVTPPKKSRVEVVRPAQPVRQPNVRVVQTQPQTAQRLDVIHLYDTPENIHLRSDLQTFYLPHGVYATVPTNTSEWALEAAFLARNPYDRQQLLDLYRFRAGQERKWNTLSNHERALRAGLEDLKRADYVRAIAAFSLAADLDHGDPAARIHLAQARLARGHYEEAATALRRAFDLQPKLIFMNLGLERCYQTPDTLKQHKNQLDTYLRANRATADAYFLLGYLSYQLGEYDTAHHAFSRVASVRPRDEVIRRFLSVTQP